MKRLLQLICPLHRNTSPERNPANFASVLFSSFPVLLLLAGHASAQAPVTPGITLNVASATGTVSTVPAGTPVTLTATVPSGGKNLVTGIVRFCDTAVAAHCTHENRLANASLTKAGTATYKFTPGPGVHSYTAVFLQQWHFNTVSSAAVPLSVTTAGTSTTTLTQSGSVGAYQLTAKVTTAGLPGIQPTGNVLFLDSSANSLQLGSVPLTAGGGSFGFSNSSVAAGVLPIASLGTGSSVAVGDFNRDGKLDMAIVGNNSTSITMMMGNGDGTFTQGASVGNFYQGVVQIKTADFNQDGIPDLALVDLNNSVIHIFLGKGDGTFTQAADAVAMSGANSITITDFNKDGIPDIIVANRYSGTVSFLLGKGDGTFTSGWDSYVSWQNPSFVLATDFNNDGNQDFVVNVLNGAGIAIYLGNGDGTFSQPTYYAVGNNPIASIAGDFTGDGTADLAVLNAGDNTVSILTGKGDGTFTVKGTFAVPANATDIATADFNGDGKADLVISTSTGSLAYFLGNGDGTFTAANVVPTSNGATSLALGDFNNDGVLDVVSANAGATAASVITKLASSSTAVLNSLSVPGNGVHQVVAKYVGDLNFGTSTSAAQALTAKTTATTLYLFTSTWISTYGQQVSLTANLSPYSVAPQTSNGETVTFFCDGKSIGTATLNSGSATLNTTALPTGFHTLTVSYGGDAVLNASSGFNFITVNSASSFNWFWFF